MTAKELIAELLKRIEESGQDDLPVYLEMNTDKERPLFLVGLGWNSDNPEIKEKEDGRQRIRLWP